MLHKYLGINVDGHTFGRWIASHVISKIYILVRESSYVLLVSVSQTLDWSQESCPAKIAVSKL